MQWRGITKRKVAWNPENPIFKSQIEYESSGTLKRKDGVRIWPCVTFLPLNPRKHTKHLCRGWGEK